MSVLQKLASALHRRDETPNIALADAIAQSDDKNAVKELAENLDNKNKHIRYDCIKVLYETGGRKPALIADYTKKFLNLLNNKDNRLRWGAMTALSCIADVQPGTIYKALPALSLAAQKGSVITKDQYIAIMVKLSAVNKYTDDVLPLLNEALLTSLPNQLPMYAEQALPVINNEYKAGFIKTVKFRLKDVQAASKQKRIEKIIKKLEAL